MSVWIEKCKRGVFASKYCWFRFDTTWFCVLAFFFFSFFSFFQKFTGVQGNNRVTVEEECLVWHYSQKMGV